MNNDEVSNGVRRVGRKGITPDQFEQAAEAILKEGGKVTVDSMRARIKGSNSTLARLLREWRGETVKATSNKTVPDELSRAYQKGVDAACAEVEKAWGEHLEKMQNDCLSWENSMSEMECDVHLLQERNEQIRTERDQLAAKYSLQADQLALAKGEIDEAETQKHEALRRVSHLEGERVMMERSFESVSDALESEKAKALINMSERQAQEVITADMKSRLERALYELARYAVDDALIKNIRGPYAR
jgi:chromosome segregation ATPase